MSSVRFFDGYTVVSDFYTGRWVWVQDAFTVAAGSDGDVIRFDMVVEDPSDATYVFDIAGGWYTPQPQSLITGGFTFDSDAPSFDWFQVRRFLKTTYDGIGYTFPYGGIYDGAAAGPFDVLSTLDIDPDSHPDWWQFSKSAAPTIVTPSDGDTVDTTGGSVFVFFDWTVPGFSTQWEVQVVDAVTGSTVYTNGTTDSATATSVPVPETNHDLHLDVRYVDDSGSSSFSDWVSITIHTTYTGAPAPPSTSISDYFVGSGSGEFIDSSRAAGTITVYPHSSPLPGDRMYLFVYVHPDVDVSGAGWTSRFDLTWGPPTFSETVRAYVFEHIYASGETSWDFAYDAMTVSGFDSSKMAWVMGAYRGIGGILLVDEERTPTVPGIDAGGVMDSPTETVSTTEAEIVFFGNWNSYSERATDPRRFDDTFGLDPNPLAPQAAGYHQLVSPGDSTDMTIDQWTYGGPVIAVELLLSLGGQGFVLGYLTFN